MKYIYTAVILFFSAVILLFISTFLFLDRLSHKTYYYVITSGTKEIGTIKVDRFTTENKILFKSVAIMPFEPLYTEYRSKLVLDNNYNFENYTKERLSGHSTDLIYIENFKKLISFVCRYMSAFTCASNIPIKKDTYIFEPDSPLTYFPIIENYNFSKGRSQGFYALSTIGPWGSPPSKLFITLTSINNDFIKIDSKKLRAENLILKIRDYPQGNLWVTMSDRVIAKIEIPSKNITIKRTFYEKSVKSRPRIVKPSGYSSKNITFDGKNIALNGTLTIPDNGDSFPAVILIWGSGPQDRDYQGLFSSMADYLSKNGFAVLRFDKRGVGQITGCNALTDSDIIADIDGAIQFLKTKKNIDPKRISLISHGDGALYAINIAANTSDIKNLILMSPILSDISDEKTFREDIENIANKSKWTDDYKNLILKTMKETKNQLDKSNNDWIYILGKKCFLTNMRSKYNFKITDIIKNIKIPILILQGQGKETDGLQKDASKMLDNIIASSGNIKHTLIYYAYLGHFLSNYVNEYIYKAYYDADKEVLKNIKNWLEDDA